MELNACPVQEATSLLLEVEVYGSSSSYGAHMMWLITAKRLLLPRRPQLLSFLLWAKAQLQTKRSRRRRGSCFPFLHFANDDNCDGDLFFQLMKKAFLTLKSLWNVFKNRLLCRDIKKSSYYCPYVALIYENDEFDFEHLCLLGQSHSHQKSNNCSCM